MIAVRALPTAVLFLALAALAHAWIPNDPGSTGTTPGGWQNDQWNFLPGTGIDAPRAWDNLIAAGRPGGGGRSGAWAGGRARSAGPADRPHGGRRGLVRAARARRARVPRARPRPGGRVR